MAEGLLGLAGSVQTSENRLQDLSVLERMDARVQSDRSAEVNAQKEQQLFFEEMYKQADGFLEKDRTNINKKIASSQRMLSNHLRESGGSKKMFMENGGFSMMNKMKNDITRSDEAVSYAENKKNLAKILEAKEKNMGHLLSPRDLKSLEDYEENENGGRITYSGIMAEVEVPPSANFDYGTDIPFLKVMSYNSNAIKIRQNYATAYPERGEPSEAQLAAFSRKMGYGGQGSNTTRLRESMVNQRKAAQYNKNKAAAKGKDDKTISFLNEVTTLISKVKAGITVADINKSKDEGGYDGSLIETMKATDSSINKLVGDKFTEKARNRALSEEGLDFTDFATGSAGKSVQKYAQNLFRDKMGLKEAYKVLEFNTFDIANAVWDKDAGYKMESGSLVDFMPDETMFRADGVQLTNSNKLDPDDNTGKYKVIGLTTALKSKSASDNATILQVNAYDDNGDLDTDSTKAIDEGYTSESALTVVMAMKNENGDLFYKEVDITRPQIKQAMTNALDVDDDLTDVVKRDNDSAQMIRDISANTKEDHIVFQGAVETLDKKVFDQPLFQTEGESYWAPGSAGQQNRNNLMKGWYMGFDFINNKYNRNAENPQGTRGINSSQVERAVDKELFTTSMVSTGMEEQLRNFGQGNSDETIIAKWLKEVNATEKQDSLSWKRHEELASKWLQTVDLINKSS